MFHRGDGTIGDRIKCIDEWQRVTLSERSSSPSASAAAATFTTGTTYTEVNLVLHVHVLIFIFIFVTFLGRLRIHFDWFDWLIKVILSKCHAWFQRVHTYSSKNYLAQNPSKNNRKHLKTPRAFEKSLSKFRAWLCICFKATLFVFCEGILGGVWGKL